MSLRPRDGAPPGELSVGCPADPRAAERSAWTLRDSETWRMVTPVGDRPRRQEWKLHLSETVGSAHQVLHGAAGVLVAHGCAFKFAVSPRVTAGLTSVRAPREHSGKFLTAYPADDAGCARSRKSCTGPRSGCPGRRSCRTLRPARTRRPAPGRTRPGAHRRALPRPGSRPPLQPRRRLPRTRRTHRRGRPAEGGTRARRRTARQDRCPGMAPLRGRCARPSRAAGHHSRSARGLRGRRARLPRRGPDRRREPAPLAGGGGSAQRRPAAGPGGVAPRPRTHPPDR